MLREPVDMGHPLLDEAELGTEEVPPALAERAEEELAESEAEAALEAELVLAPALGGRSDDVIDPEELEARMESETEAAELLSLHVAEPLSEAFLDEGPSLEALEPEAVEEAVELDADHEGTEFRSGLERIDLERFRRLLEADRLRLQGLEVEFEEEGLRQRSERDDLVALSAVDQHPADLGTETFVRERDLSIREQVEGELAEVARAIQRLDAGTYGRCEACGRPIGIARLAAEPATRFCLADQRELERESARKHREVEPLL